MKFSNDTAQKLAKQIRVRFGLKIARAVQGTPVPAKFVAGLISVEAGKKNGQITETATRFEPHVFAKLKQVRDGGLTQYNKIRRAQLKDATDDALQALSKSYGLTQVMGWWSLHLDCAVADLRDPEKHLDYAVKLMLLNSNGDFERQEYVGEYKQWNSGSETGKTHDPDYVFNAGSVMDAYAEFDPIEADSLVTDSVTKPAQPETPVTQINVEHAEEVKASTPLPVEGGRKDDAPKQASQGGTKSVIATAIGVLGGAGTAIGGWLQNSAALKIVGLLCITIVLLALVFRQLIMDYVRMTYMSDPTRINVK